MRTFAAVALTGTTAILVLKLLMAVVFPLLGLFIGLIAMTVKLALMAAVVFFFYSLFKKRKAAHEVEVEVG